MSLRAGDLAWECRLIAEAGRLIDPDAYFARDRDAWIRDQRFKLGLCADEDCDEEVATPIHALDVPPLDHTHCAEHASEALLEEDDAPDEGD